MLFILQVDEELVQKIYPINKLLFCYIRSKEISFFSKAQEYLNFDAEWGHSKFKHI